MKYPIYGQCHVCAMKSHCAGDVEISIVYNLKELLQFWDDDIIGNSVTIDWKGEIAYVILLAQSA